MQSILLRLGFGLFGACLLGLAAFLWIQGGPERGRLARLGTEGRQVQATIAAIDLDRRPATTPSGETIRGKYETVRMARVRYTIGGVTFTPDQRFSLAADQATLDVGSPFLVIVLPDVPDKPFSSRDSVGTTRVAAFLLPLMLAMAGGLCVWGAVARHP